MARKSLRFTTLMLVMLGFFLNTNTASAQTLSADIQKGKGDGAITTTTSLQVAAGDEITVEVFATGYTDAQGVEVSLEVSDITEFVTVDAQGNYATGSSSEFPVVINSVADNVVTMSAVSFGVTKTHSGDPKLVAKMTMKLASTFSGATIAISKIDFGGNPVDPNISFSLTLPLNNLVTNIATTRRYNSARLVFRTKLDGVSNAINYRAQGATEWLTAQTTLEGTTSTDVIAAVRALRAANVNIQQTTPTALATALTAASITNTAETFIANIKLLDAAISTRLHEVELTGLAGNTIYEYEITATSIDGDLSPAKTGTFRTRLSPDVRPAAITDFNTVRTSTSAILRWRTNRAGTTLYKVYARDNGTRGALLLENSTPNTTTGLTSHSFRADNLTQGTEYEYEIGTRLVGVDAIISDNLMSEADANATKTGIFKTRGTLPEIGFTRFQKIVRGSNNAQITVYANQPSTIIIDYGVHTVGRPSGAVPTGTDFDADPLYPNRVSSTDAQSIHVIDLEGLEANTRYRYRVTAYPLDGDNSITTDPRGRTKYNKDFTFQTLRAIAAPTITAGPSVRSYRQQAWFEVKTNVPTSLDLYYGESSTFGTADEIQVQNVDQYGNPRITKSHRVLLAGLSALTTYQFRMVFTNSDGQTVTFPQSSTKGAATKFQVAGSSGIFDTSGLEDTTNPLITRGPTIVAASENSLTIE